MHDHSFDITTIDDHGMVPLILIPLHPTLPQVCLFPSVIHALCPANLVVQVDAVLRGKTKLSLPPVQRSAWSTSCTDQRGQDVNVVDRL
jgi:hypothetical protein